VWQSEIFYTQTQYTKGMLMDRREREKAQSKDIILNFRHTVVLLGRHEPVGTV
jgi:hypothetical protein